jgi:hypothetical protein
MALPVATVVSSPPLTLLYDALGEWSLPAIAAATGLMVSSSAPALVALSRRTLALAAAGLTLASVAAIAAAKLSAPFDVDAPAHVSIRSYAADGEAQTMLFAPDGAPGALARMFPEKAAAWPWSHEPPTGSAASTGDAPSAPPTLEVVSTTDVDAPGAQPMRDVAVVLRSARGASIVGIAMAPGDVAAVRMHGEAMAPPEQASHRHVPWPAYECLTTPPEGVDVDLRIPKGLTASVYVYDRKPGLPPGEATRLTEARGNAAAPYGGGDYSVVARHLSL